MLIRFSSYSSFEFWDRVARWVGEGSWLKGWDAGFEQGSKWWKDVVAKSNFSSGVSISKNLGIADSGALVIENPKAPWSGIFSRTLWLVEPNKEYILKSMQCYGL